MLFDSGQVLTLSLFPLLKKDSNIPILLGYCGLMTKWIFIMSSIPWSRASVILTVTSITLIIRGQLLAQGHTAGNGRAGTCFRVCIVGVTPAKGSFCCT